MCQTLKISRSIGRIGRRSFERRMCIASPLYVENDGEVGKLLDEVDKLSDQLHKAFPTISEQDYRVFGPKLNIVIDTLRSLRKESLSHSELKAYDARLRQQISDLEELTQDIVTFRINAPKNKELQSNLSTLSKLNLSKYAQ